MIINKIINISDYIKWEKVASTSILTDAEKPPST